MTRKVYRWGMIVDKGDRTVPILQSRCVNSYLICYGNKISFCFNSKPPQRMKNWLKALKITVKKGDK